MLDWVAREQPDVLCLQEMKASPEQVPASLTRARRLLVLLARPQGVLGRGAAPREARVPERAGVLAPRVRPREPDRRRAGRGRARSPRSTSRTAARTSPRRCASSRRWTRSSSGCHRDGHERRALRRPQRRAARDRRAPEAAQRRSRSARPRASARCFERLLSRGLVDLGRRFDPDDDRLFTWWAPWRQPARAQHRVAARLRPRLEPPLAEQATRCESFREFGTSDHGPVAATLELPGVRPEGDAGNSRSPRARPDLDAPAAAGRPADPGLEGLGPARRFESCVKPASPPKVPAHLGEELT